MDINLVKNLIRGVSLVKVGHRPNFDQFHKKITYFDQIDPINDSFDQIYVHKPD